MAPPAQFLEPADVARLASLSGVPLTPARIRSLADAGVIPVAGITPRGSRLFAAEAVERFLSERANARRSGDSTGPGRQERS
jgi:hypothetical protein